MEYARKEDPVLAFLLAVAAVWCTERESLAGWLGGLLLLLLSVSIYQAYIAIAGSFFVRRSYACFSFSHFSVHFFRQPGYHRGIICLK